MENKFKYRPEVKSIEDLQPGDEFLVGDERWKWDSTTCLVAGGNLQMWHGPCVARNLIRANVPIERDIPYPEGGAEKWELREGDPYNRSFLLKDKRTLFWLDGEWINAHETWRAPSPVNGIYAIPKAKPQDKAKPAPKEYTVQFDGHFPGVGDICHVPVGEDFKPGDRVTVQRVSEQGEGT
jgi:hypothetical protein